MLNFYPAFNFHPAISSFPSALLLMALGCEVVSLIQHKKFFSQMSAVLLVLCLPITIVTFITGYNAADTASVTFVVPQNAISAHFEVARNLIFLLIPTVALKFVYERATHNKSFFFALYFLTLTLSVLFVVYASYLGGELVFSHGAGVKAPSTP